MGRLWGKRTIEDMKSKKKLMPHLCSPSANERKSCDLTTNKKRTSHSHATVISNADGSFVVWE